MLLHHHDVFERVCVSDTHTHARTHTRARAHTHRGKETCCGIHIVVSREGSSGRNDFPANLLRKMHMYLEDREWETQRTREAKRHRRGEALKQREGDIDTERQRDRETEAQR